MEKILVLGGSLMGKFKLNVSVCGRKFQPPSSLKGPENKH